MHFSPEDATRKNGLLEFMVGMSVITFAIAAWSPPGQKLGLAMIADGGFRWAFALTHECACGLLVLEIPVRLWIWLWSLARGQRARD